MRKDYLEIILKQKLRDHLYNSEATIPIDYNGGTIDVPVYIDIQKVFLSRGLEKKDGEDGRYRIFIFGGVELKRGLLPDYLVEYYNRVLLSYRQEINNEKIMIYGYENVLDEMTTPNFYLKGFFRPIDESSQSGNNSEEYILEFDDFQIHDLIDSPGFLTDIEGKALEAFNAKLNEINPSTQQPYSIMKIKDLNDELADKNPFLEISMPSIFETDATLIGLDYCDDDESCIEYPDVESPPESSFSSIGEGNIAELRISEDVIDKAVGLEVKTQQEDGRIVTPLSTRAFVENNRLVVDYQFHAFQAPFYYCNVMDFRYVYNFNPEKWTTEDSLPIGIELESSSHSSGSCVPVTLGCHGVCKLIENGIHDKLKGKTQKISSPILKRISTVHSLAEKINLSSYEIDAYFESGEDFGDIVFALKQPSPEKDKYLKDYNWLFMDNNGSGISNVYDKCWYTKWYEGERCDLDGDGIKDYVDDKVYSAESMVNASQWEDEPKYNEECNEMTGRNFYIKSCEVEKDVHYGEYLDLEGSVKMKKVYETQEGRYVNNPLTFMTSYYCYCGNDKNLRGDCSVEGTCGPHHGNPGKVINDEFGKNTWKPMYNESIESTNNIHYEKRSGDKTINLSSGIYVRNTSSKWNWQYDFKYKYGIENIIEWDMKKNYPTQYGVYNEKDYNLFILEKFNASRTQPSHRKIKN